MRTSRRRRSPRDQRVLRRHEDDLAAAALVEQDPERLARGQEVAPCEHRVVSSQSASVVSVIGALDARPADATRKSRPPYSSTVRRVISATASSLVTSTGTAEELTTAYGPRLGCRARRCDERGGGRRDDAAYGARVRRHRHPRRVGRSRDERTDHRDDARGLGAQLRGARTGLLPRRARDVPGAARAGPRRLGRLRRVEERARRGSERRRVLVGEGRLAASRALPGRGGRTARDPRQHRQPRRRDPGLEHLVVRLEGRTREHIRRQRGRAADLLPGPHQARGGRLPEDVAEAIAFFAGRARPSRPEMSSTSTAASPPRTPGSA